MSTMAVSVSFMPVIRHDSPGAVVLPFRGVNLASVADSAAASGAAVDARQGDLRLTRRGRVVVAIVGFLASAGAALGVSSISTAAGEAAPMSSYVVASGDTLWAIARSVAPAGQTADMVEHLKDLNNLSGGAIQSGQTLRVPAAQ